MNNNASPFAATSDVVVTDLQTLISETHSDTIPVGTSNTTNHNTRQQQEEPVGKIRRNSSRLIPLPTPPKQNSSESLVLDGSLNSSKNQLHTRPPMTTIKQQSVSNSECPPSIVLSELEILLTNDTAGEVVRNAKVFCASVLLDPPTTNTVCSLHDHETSTKKKDPNDIGVSFLPSPNNTTNFELNLPNNSSSRVRALSCSPLNSESSPPVASVETKPRTMSINSISSFLNQQSSSSLQQQQHSRTKSNCSQDLNSENSSLYFPNNNSSSCPLPNCSLNNQDHHVVFSQSLSPPKTSKIGVPIMKKYPSMKDDLIAKSTYVADDMDAIMNGNDYTRLMKSNESLCLDCRNIGCKCIVVTISNEKSSDNNKEENVALDLIGTVLLTTNRIVFLIDEDMSLNQYPTNGHALPKMIEVLLSNIEVIEKNSERNMCMTVIEKSDSGNGDISPPPIRLIKKYELFAFDSTTTFQRAFKTFNDMLNVARLETTNGKISNHLQHVKSKDALATLKKSYLSKKRVSVDQSNTDSVSSNTPKKYLSPLEEAITNNFSLAERKIFTPPPNKSKSTDPKHKRSISLSSPIHYDTTKHFSSGHSDLSDHEERRTFISDHGAHGSTSLSEHSADETEPKKRRSRKKEKTSAIPTLSIDPPSQLFDEQFDCMIDEITHNFTSNIQVEVNDIFKSTDKKNPKMKTLVTKSLVGVSAAEVFQLFFSSDSTFLKQAHNKVGDQEIEIYDWVDFQVGSPSVRGITYKVGGSFPNHFSAFTQNPSRILETQRIVLMENPPKLNKHGEEIPMSYFILFTSAATQDLPNNQMFQFDVKYIVKDVKPSNLLLKRECEIQITGTAQCKGGTFFWRSKSTESSVLKAVKSRLLIILNLMEEKIQSLTDERRHDRSDQQSKAWEATVVSTMVSLDGGFPKEMPPLNNLLPPPQCLDSSPPPTPRKLSDDFSDSSDDDDLTYGSTISMIGASETSENEPVNKRVKTVGHSSTSHLTVTPPIHSLSNNSLDMSPTFDNAKIKSKKLIPSPLINNTSRVDNVVDELNQQDIIETSHSSLTITDERPRQLTSLGPLFTALWGFIMMVVEQAMGYMSTISSYLIREVVEPAIKMSWDLKDTVFTIVILILIFSLLFNNYSAINRLDSIKKEASLMRHELSLKYSLSKSIIHKVMDPQNSQKTPKEMEYSIRELVKDYLFENRKLQSSIVQKKDLISQMINFKQALNERRNKQQVPLTKQENSHHNTTTLT